MNNEQLIRKGVVILGWKWASEERLIAIAHGTHLQMNTTLGLSALAFDLMDMVDDIGGYALKSFPKYCVIRDINHNRSDVVVQRDGADRRMNIIRACVEFFEELEK